MDHIYYSKAAKMSTMTAGRKRILFWSPEEEQPGLLASTKGRRRKKAIFNVCKVKLRYFEMSYRWVLFRYIRYGYITILSTSAFLLGRLWSCWSAAHEAVVMINIKMCFLAMIFRKSAGRFLKESFAKIKGNV